MRLPSLVFLLLVLSCARQRKPDEGASAAAPSAPATANEKTGGKPNDGASAPIAVGKWVPGSSPTSRVDATRELLHGVQVPDPYRWLEDEKSAEVQKWMKAQDAAARERLAGLPGRSALARRFKELFYVDAVGAPVKRAKRFFLVRTHSDREKAIVYWKEGERGEEKTLLDPNKWSADGTVSLGRWVPSWDGRKVVYQKKPNAADEATLYVIDVDKGEVATQDIIPGAKYARPAWTPDSSGFYYEWLPVDAAIPIAERPGYTEIRFHKLGADPMKDPVVHPRTGDPSTFLSCDLSRDGRYLFAVISRGWSENDVFLKDVKKGGPFRPLIRGKDATYEAEIWEGQIYILTNEGASNQRLFKTPVAKAERKHWKEIVQEDPAASLQSFSIVGGHLVLRYLRSAATVLRIASLDGTHVRPLVLPAVGTASDPRGLHEQDDAYFEFSSFTIPQQVYKASMRTGKVELFAKVNLPIDPAPYVVEQVFYPSQDGTQISMFVVRRSDAPRDGANPVLLYGYGGFNISLTPSFKASIYPWLEAGGIYAVPNLRGGGEYGKKWHDAGRLHVKQNVFDDFVAAAEYLVKERYTRPSRLAIAGGSNGGLLTGAAMTQRPDLLGAVVCAVPLLDMVRYHLFGSGKTWIPEYGTAEKEADFKVLHAYSPYHNVKPGTKYPPLLLLSADHDDRVDPMHARKFAAAIQAASASGAPAYLRIESNAGHGGADQVKKAIESSADQYVFLFKQLEVPPPVAK